MSGVIRCFGRIAILLGDQSPREQTIGSLPLGLGIQFACPVFGADGLNTLFTCYRPSNVCVSLDDLGLQCGGCRVHRAECRLGLIDLRLECFGVDQRNKLAFCYLRVEVGVKRFDIARYLAANLHIDNGIERARGRYARLDQPSFHGHCVVANRVLRMHPPQFHAYTQDGDDTDHQRPFGPFVSRGLPDLRRGSGIRWSYDRLRRELLCCRKIDLIYCDGHKSRFLCYPSRISVVRRRSAY